MIILPSLTLQYVITFYILETPIAVWRVLDALIRVKRLIVEAVEQWNMRLSESFKKRDIDKKKDKTSHADLESPITPDSRSLNNHLGDSDTKHQNTEITTNAFTKKIKSLDQSDGKFKTLLTNNC